MALWAGKERVAVGFGPDRLRLLVARRNGGLKVVHSAAAELPAGAVRASLQAPAFVEPGIVSAAVRGLVEAAREAGHLGDRPELVVAVIPDASVKMAATPLQGAAPSRAEGERMARWALRDLLPLEPETIRASWSVLEAPGEDKPARWFVSVGAAEAVVRAHEELLLGLGWSAGRVVPWTLAAGLEDAVGNGSSEPLVPPRQLVLCDGDGALACVFEADGVPRLHRTWRARVAAERICAELPTLRQYVMDHLEMAIDRIRVCGQPAWTAVAAAAAVEAGLQPHVTAPEDALLGALRG